MKLYLSGKITGTSDAPERFGTAQTALAVAGYTVVNPLEVTQADTWESCMRDDIKALLDCDGIVMLEGWERSRGAQLELHIAEALGMPIYTLAYASVRRQAVLVHQTTVGW